MKIIVTGGAGFIGGNFVHYMINKYPDYEIICLDKLTYAGNLETLEPVMDKKGFKFVKGDIADREFVYKLFEDEKPDIVVNFAAESHVDRSITDPGIFLQTNIIGTGVLLMRAAYMVYRDIIRYLLMKYMETFRLTDRICSLQKQHRFILQVRILHQRRLQTCLYLHITEHLRFLLQYQDALIITVRIIFRRSSFLL